MKILLGVTGSIASVLTDKMLVELSDAGHTTALVVTPSALKIGENYSKEVEHLKNTDSYFDDAHEWSRYKTHQEVLHIELVKWADLFLIAPCSGNTLAKIAGGVCDNLLTCIARAWDFDKRFIIAPAMNTRMWQHPVTARHIETIRQWGSKGIEVIAPQSKKLYCGDEGPGAMADISEIIKQLYHK
jgi:phosphopantothenoylcysteine decarboxylase